MRNVVVCDVVSCRSCVNQWTNVSEERIASIFRVQESASEEPAWGTQVNARSAAYPRRYWVNAHSVALPLPPPTQSYTGSGLLPAGPSPQTLPLSLYWFPMWSTLPHLRFLYSWVFATGGSVCSHLLTLVPRSRIFLSWRWRLYFPPKHRFTQDLHGATSQKRACFISLSLWERRT
jgi:hypothetical protein